MDANTAVIITIWGLRNANIVTCLLAWFESRGTQIPLFLQWGSINANTFVFTMIWKSRDANTVAFRMIWKSPHPLRKKTMFWKSPLHPRARRGPEQDAVICILDPGAILGLLRTHQNQPKANFCSKYRFRTMLKRFCFCYRSQGGRTNTIVFIMTWGSADANTVVFLHRFERRGMQIII